jgi:LysM repeat protein
MATGRLIILGTVLLITLTVSSCGLKRSNPLDPLGNSGVVTPDPVVGITYSTSAANQNPRSVTLRWTANSPSNTSGYYVYRGLGYFSAFALIDSVQVNEYIHSSASDITVQPGDYYYRISAYKGYPAGNLEGRKSEPIFVRIP